MGQWDTDCGIPNRELGVSDRENGVHPSLPQTSGLLCLPQAPLCTQTDTQTSRTHTLTHTYTPTRAVPSHSSICCHFTMGHAIPQAAQTPTFPQNPTPRLLG